MYCMRRGGFGRRTAALFSWICGPCLGLRFGIICEDQRDVSVFDQVLRDSNCDKPYEPLRGAQNCALGVMFCAWIASGVVFEYTKSEEWGGTNIY